MSLHLVFHITLKKSLSCTLANVLTDFSQNECLLALFRTPVLWLPAILLFLSDWISSVTSQYPWCQLLPQSKPNVVKSAGCHVWPFRKRLLFRAFICTCKWVTISRPTHIQVYFHIPPLSVCILGSWKLGHTQTVTAFWPTNSIISRRTNENLTRTWVWKILTLVS